MDEMERHTQQVRRFYHRWRECSPCAACMHSVCGVRWAWRITAGLCHAYFHSVAIATQPVHRLQIRPIVHN